MCSRWVIGCRWGAWGNGAGRPSGARADFARCATCGNSTNSRSANGTVSTGSHAPPIPPSTRELAGRGFEPGRRVEAGPVSPGRRAGVENQGGRTGFGRSRAAEVARDRDGPGCDPSVLDVRDPRPLVVAVAARDRVGVRGGQPGLAHRPGRFRTDRGRARRRAAHRGHHARLDGAVARQGRSELRGLGDPHASRAGGRHPVPGRRRAGELGRDRVRLHRLERPEPRRALDRRGGAAARGRVPRRGAERDARHASGRRDRGLPPRARRSRAKERAPPRGCARRPQEHQPRRRRGPRHAAHHRRSDGVHRSGGVRDRSGVEQPAHRPPRPVLAAGARYPAG